MKHCCERRIVVLIHCYLLRTKVCCTYSLLVVTNKGLLYLFIRTLPDTTAHTAKVLRF
jgi:hypothetical protein